MADNEAALPERTDTVIAGASKTGTVTTDPTLVAEREIPLPSGDA